MKTISITTTKKQTVYLTVNATAEGIAIRFALAGQTFGDMAILRFYGKNWDKKEGKKNEVKMWHVWSPGNPCTNNNTPGISDSFRLSDVAEAIR